MRFKNWSEKAVQGQKSKVKTQLSKKLLRGQNQVEKRSREISVEFICAMFDVRIFPKFH